MHCKHCSHYVLKIGSAGSSLTSLGISFPLDFVEPTDISQDTEMVLFRSALNIPNVIPMPKPQQPTWEALREYAGSETRG